MIKLNIDESFFDEMHKAIYDGRERIRVSKKVSGEDAIILYKLFLSKYPELIHIDPCEVGFIAGLVDNYICVRPKRAWNSLKKTTGQFTLTDVKLLENIAEDIVEKQQLRQKSDFNKAIAIYDYLSDNVEYCDGEHAHDAWGAIVEKKAVCEGIAFAFCLLAKKCGLDVAFVTGRLKGGAHAWNLVCVDGLVYHLDVTSNLRDGGRQARNYDYIYLKDDDMKQYTWDKGLYPRCTSDKHNYFMVTHSFAKNKSEAVDIIVKQIKNHNIVYFRCCESMKLDDNLIDELLSAVSDKLDMTHLSLEILINAGFNTVQIIYK